MKFEPSRFKVQIKLAISRLKMMESKKSSINQSQRREIAELLQKGKEESARIRVSSNLKLKNFFLLPKIG